MGDILSSHQANQTTKNFQATSQSGTASSIEKQGKGAANAVGNGISLVLNTGGNKVSSKNSKATAKPARANGTSGATSPSASGSDTSKTTGSGAINVSIAQSDSGAIQAGTSVSLASIGAIKDANDNIVSLAEHALQQGASVAALAIPTYAAAEVAGNAINPQPVVVETGGGTDTGFSGNTSKILIGLSVVGFALTLGMFFKRRGRA